MNKFATLALTSLSALTLASCSLIQQGQETVASKAASASSAASSVASSAASAVSSAAETATSSAVTQATVSLDDAKKAVFDQLGIAEADVANLMVKEDTENGKPVYEIDFDHNGTEHSYTVDGTSGQVVERDQEMADATATTATSTATTANLTADDAKVIALDDFAVTYGTTEADLDNLVVKTDTDNGMTIYEVDFIYNGSEVSYDIDGATGNVLAYEIN